MKRPTPLPCRLLACLAVSSLAFALPAFADDAPGDVARDVLQRKADGQAFLTADLFGDATDLAFARSSARWAAHAAVRDVVSEATLAELDTSALAAVRRGRPSTLALQVPYTAALAGAVELELVRVELFTDDFRVVTSSGRTPDVDLGVHYRGMVRGEPESLAAVSLYQGEVMGLVTSPTLGNLVIGRLGGQDRLRGAAHVVYAEEDLVPASSFACGVEGEAPVPIGDADAPLSRLGTELDLPATQGRSPGDCVQVYVEADYDIYQYFGTTSGVTSHVTGVFNQSATLFANESITSQMSQLYIWTTPSPYTGTDTLTLLQQFGNTRTSFNGDLAHLVLFHGGGGRAYLDVLCSPSTNLRMAVSALDSFYATVPTYSWSVYVFTHEMGHNLGSSHTQACVWNGNNTAIDGCYTPEGSCPQPGYPSNGGTIMSYCHLVPSVGINFNNGFGPQPGDLIRSRVDAASCLSTCGGGGGDDAEIQVAQSSFPSHVLPGSTANVTVRVKNTGGTTWSAGDLYRLGADTGDGFRWTAFGCNGYSLEPGNSRAYLCNSVPPGSSHDFTFSIEYPDGAFTGEVPLKVRMVRDGVAWFGQSHSTDVDVDGYSTCGCSGGTSYWGQPIPSGDTWCGFRVCGLDNQLYQCNSGGWGGTGTYSCNCQCTGGWDYLGNAVDPDYTYCGFEVCGSDHQVYRCNSWGWSALGTSCP